jgi:hypothetical protein
VFLFQIILSKITFVLNVHIFCVFHKQIHPKSKNYFLQKVYQDHVELRNDDDINIPFARLTSTERQPLSSFPRIWSQFPDEQIKFTRNVPEFNKLLKQHYLRKLLSTPGCTRLFCPHCMPPLNALDDDSNDSN